MTVKAITVRINADDDAMIGAEGWGNYDASASTEQFVAAVEAAIKADYPDTSIRVFADISLFDTKISIDSDESAQEEELITEYVRNIINHVWQTWTWLVEA